MAEISKYVQKVKDEPLVNGEVPGINRNVVVTAPCSFGKTICAVYLMHQAYLKGVPSLFILPYTPLIYSSYKAIQIATGLVPNIIWSQWSDKKYGETDPNSLLTFASLGTLANRDLPKAGVVIIDEAHGNLLGDVPTRIFEHYADSWIFGLTATPERTNKKEGMSQRYSELIVGAHSSVLIDIGAQSGYREGIVPFRYMGMSADNEIDLEGVRTTAGDYNKSDLQERCNTNSVNLNAVASWKKHAWSEGRGSYMRTIAFCTGIDHSQDLVKTFNADPELKKLYSNGVARHIDGDANQDERREMYRGLARGDFAVLSSVDLLAVGFDLKCIEALLDMQPTKSPARHIQKLGRLARVCWSYQIDENGDEVKDGGTEIMVDSDGNHLQKTEGLVLDIAGNVTRLGRKGFFEMYAPKELDDPQESNGEAPMKKCPQCGTFHYTFQAACPECHYVYPLKELRERVGELVELMKPNEKEVYKIYKRKLRQAVLTKGWLPEKAFHETKIEADRKKIPWVQPKQSWKMGVLFKNERSKEVVFEYIQILARMVANRPHWFRSKRWDAASDIYKWIRTQVILEFSKDAENEKWWNDIENSIKVVADAMNATWSARRASSERMAANW